MSLYIFFFILCMHVLLLLGKNHERIAILLKYNIKTVFFANTCVSWSGTGVIYRNYVKQRQASGSYYKEQMPKY